jgi:hypothetical protein
MLLNEGSPSRSTHASYRARQSQVPLNSQNTSYNEGPPSRNMCVARNMHLRHKCNGSSPPHPESDDDKWEQLANVLDHCDTITKQGKVQAIENRQELKDLRSKVTNSYNQATYAISAISEVRMLYEQLRAKIEKPPLSERRACGTTMSSSKRNCITSTTHRQPSDNDGHNDGRMNNYSMCKAEVNEQATLAAGKVLASDRRICVPPREVQVVGILVEKPIAFLSGRQEQAYKNEHLTRGDMSQKLNVEFAHDASSPSVRRVSARAERPSDAPLLRLSSEAAAPTRDDINTGFRVTQCQIVPKPQQHLAARSAARICKPAASLPQPHSQRLHRPQLLSPQTHEQRRERTMVAHSGCCAQSRLSLSPCISTLLPGLQLSSTSAR